MMETIEQVRERFAQEIQQQARIRTAGLIAGLAAVPREKFLGPGPWKLVRPTEMREGYQLTPDDDPRHLYQNVVAALDERRKLNNGEPAALTQFMDALDLVQGDRLLHIGCGVGYYTAIAAHAVGPQGRVLGVEIDPELASRAAKNLSAYPTVSVLHRDGTTDVLGSFDAIFVNAGCTRPLAMWLDQLAPGGRLVLPLTVSLPDFPAAGMGAMLRVVRDETGYSARFTSPVGIFHCAGARAEGEEALLKQAFEGGNSAAVIRLRRDVHATQPDCWLHTDSFCLQLDPALRRQKPMAIALPAARLAVYAGRYELAPGVMLTVALANGGRYELAPGVVLTVSVADSGLAVQIPGNSDALHLYPATEQQFFFEELDGGIRFVTDGQGRVNSLVFEMKGRQKPAQRLE